MTDKFEFQTKIRDKVVKYRKWKVKDKKKLLANTDNPLLTKEAMVFDCLEDKKIALSEDEFKYMLFKIREESISEKIKFKFECGSCSKPFDYDADLNEIMTPEFKDYGEIEYNGHIINIGSLRNREFYESTMNNIDDEDEKYLADFLFHIESYNDNEYTFETLNEKINDLDVDVFEKIFKAWEEMRFKIDNVKEVKCPSCGFEEFYEFDALPGFFPESWNR